MTARTEHYLQSLFAYLQMSAKQFSESIGEKRAEKLYHVLRGRNGVSEDLARTIAKKYPEINYTWLLTGEGEMLKQNTTYATLSATSDTTSSATSDTTSQAVPTAAMSVPPTSKFIGLPLIPFGFVAGYNENNKEFNNFERYHIPDFENIGAEFIVRVSGSSMYPKYSSGDLLACRKIHDVLFFQWGKVYVIDSSQGQLIKRVFPDENKDYITLVSDNKDKYPPFTMPKSDIQSLSIVLGVVRVE